MAKYPIESQRGIPLISQRGIPSPSGGFRASLSIPGAEGDLWQQIGALAGKGQDLLLQMHLQQASIQFDDAVLQAETEEEALANRLQENTDENTYERELETSLAKINSYVPKNPYAAAQYRSWVKKNMPGWQDSIVDAKRLRIQDKAVAGILTHISQGDTGRMETSIQSALKLGFISETDAVRFRERGAAVAKELAKEAKEAAEIAQDTALFQEAQALPEEEGFALVNTVHDSQRRNNLKSRLTDYHALRKRANNESVARAISFNTVAEVQRYMAGELPALDATDSEKNEYRLQLQNRMEVIAKGSEVISDPAYLREMKNRGIDITDEDETFVDYIAEGDKAAYGPDPTLNGEEWESIKAKARTKYEASQKDALKRAVDLSQNLIEGLTPVLQAAQEKVLRGETVDKAVLAELALFREEQQLQKELQAATEEKMHAWADKKENRNKNARDTYVELSAIYRNARDVRDAGIEALRAERVARELGLSKADREVFNALIGRGYTIPQAVDYIKETRPQGASVAKKPVRKGPIPNPTFKMASPQKPEQVFDDTGAETGLRLADGSVFKVGSRMKRGGRTLEYLGNHQWKEVK